MKIVGFLFGANSFEHEVSITSLRSVLTNWSNKMYEVIVFGFDKNNILQKFSKEEFLRRFSSYTTFLQADNPCPLESIKECSCVFSLVHGNYGEDGALQGLLSLLGIPFVGPNILSSAVCMDKDVAKRLVRAAGLNVVDWICLRSYEKLDLVLFDSKIGFPCFVKPANSGSSCGVSCAENLQQLIEAIEWARSFSSKVLIEKKITGMELECAVFGIQDLVASGVGRVIPKNKFYDYEAKYVLEDGAAIEAPAQIDLSLEKAIQSASKEIFKILECEMMARVDFFYDGKLFFNEINTVPGFTPISLYPKLLSLTGINYQQLIDELIEMALIKHPQFESAVVLKRG